MIGEMRATISLQPTTGDRVDAVARVIVPGDSDYSFPIAITRLCGL
jgi:hypothetical protein